MIKSSKCWGAKFIGSIDGIVKLEYVILASLLIVASYTGIRSLGKRVQLKAAISYVELACKKGGKAIIESKIAECKSDIAKCDTEAKLKNLCAEYQ